MAKKKTYNPFKMWGSYVGAVIGFFIPSLWQTIIIDQTFSDFWWNFTFNLQGIDVYLLYVVLSSVIGFLVGWGIHSFVGASRRKK